MALVLRATKGSALTHDEMDANFAGLSTRMGWEDYNDAATASTPLTVPVAPTTIKLTNDGAGAFTNVAYRIPGATAIWDTSASEFDFSGLSLGDTVDYRLDITVTTAAPNAVITTGIAMAQGSGADYTLSIDQRAFKSAGTYQIVRWSSIYMGDTNTLNFPAWFVISCDAAGSTAVVNGWYVRTLKWGGDGT